MRNLMLVCAGLALIAAIVWVNPWREPRAGREPAAGPQSQAPAVVERDSGPASPAQPAAPVPAGKPETSAVPQAGNKAAAASISQFLAEDAARLKAQSQDPEYRKARLAQVRMALPQEYPGLAEELGLTPEEAGRLFDLLAEIQAEKLDANANTSFNSGGPGDLSAIQELMRARQEIQRRRDESLVALLGNAGYEQFKEYEAGRPGRARVDALARTLASLGQPLSDVQARPLAAVFIAEEKRKQQLSQKTVGDRRPGEPVDQAGIDEEFLEFQAESNRRILDAAQGNLHAQQLETLRAVLDQPLAQARAAARVRREQSKAQQR